MNVSAPFIVRPIATTLLMIGLTLLGLVAYFAAADRRRAAGRYSDHPGVAPACRAPTPRPWRRRWRRRSRRQLALISGVTSISSTSSLGQTSIQVEFDLGRNVDGAAQDVQTRDQRRRRPVAQEPAESADLREGQSGRRAVDVDRGHVGRPADLEGRRLRRELSRAADLPHYRRRAGRFPRPAEAGDARPDQSDGASPRWA